MMVLDRFRRAVVERIHCMLVNVNTTAMIPFVLYVTRLVSCCYVSNSLSLVPLGGVSTDPK